MAATAQADVLTEAELNAWLSAVGSLRLVLGTRLDVSEDMEAPDPEDPTAPEYALYELLGQLQYLMIEVLASASPTKGDPRGHCDRQGAEPPAPPVAPEEHVDPSANLQKP